MAKCRARAIEQGYLAADPERKIEVRLRRRDKRRCLTIKQGEGTQRVEVELPLSQTEFDALWPATEGRRLVKTRYRLPKKKGSPAARLELDVYEAALAGLRVVEAEFSDEAAARAFEPLPWFGREVTDDSAYRNAELARQGLPTVTAARGDH
ncbi:MAG: adenylate cyclase [Verrucomicrobia bacterium]|nr:adenylate cyclase [Verrucomicrobiota bacterium]